MKEIIIFWTFFTEVRMCVANEAGKDGDRKDDFMIKAVDCCYGEHILTSFPEFQSSIRQITLIILRCLPVGFTDICQ